MNCTGINEATFKVGNQTGYCCEVDLWQGEDPLGGSGWGVSPWSQDMVEELAIACVMTDPGGPFPDAEVWAGLQHRLFLEEFAECMDPEILAELEWEECCEPSYFKTYDMSTGDSHMIGGPVPVLHDAQRHEQQCSLNDLVNPGHPLSTDKAVGPVRSEFWERNYIFEVAILMELELVAIGENYGVGLGRYGAAWIPKSCLHYLPPLGSTFMADTKISKKGKYPLRLFRIRPGDPNRN